MTGAVTPATASNQASATCGIGRLCLAATAVAASTTRKLRSTARRAADSSKSSPASVTRPSAGMFARVYRPVRKPAPSGPHGRTPRPAALQKGINSSSAERSTSEYWGCRLTKGAPAFAVLDRN
jgi:hypothetical protein